MNNERLKELLELYKQYTKIFNEWETTKNDEKDKIDYIYLSRIYINLTDLLVSNNIIERYGIKKYKVIESGEIL